MSRVDYSHSLIKSVCDMHVAHATAHFSIVSLDSCRGCVRSTDQCTSHSLPGRLSVQFGVAMRDFTSPDYFSVQCPLPTIPHTVCDPYLTPHFPICSTLPCTALHYSTSVLWLSAAFSLKVFLRCAGYLGVSPFRYVRLPFQRLAR